MSQAFVVSYTKRWRRNSQGWIETWVLGRFRRDYALNKAGQFGRCIEGVWTWE